MRSTSRFFAIASAVLAATIFTASAAASTTVQVPFSFTVKGKTLPAGTYSVQSDRFEHAVTLTSPDMKSFTWILQPGDPSPSDYNVTLRFDEADGNYALRTVQYHALTTPRLDKHVSDDSRVHVIRGE